LISSTMCLRRLRGTWCASALRACLVRTFFSIPVLTFTNAFFSLRLLTAMVDEPLACRPG
jgi:hypothetical protein